MYASDGLPGKNDLHPKKGRIRMTTKFTKNDNVVRWPPRKPPLPRVRSPNQSTYATKRIGFGIESVIVCC